MTASRWLIGTAAVLAACSSATRTAERVPLSTKEIVDRYKPAVVRVDSERGVGTGFVVAPDGRIATNLHVIAGADEVTVELADQRKFAVQKVLALDPQRDLAIVQIEASDLPTVPLGNSDVVSAGDPVVVIGNPLGVLDFTVSDGLISAVRQRTPETRVIQTSAPISQGSSGGPLFNRYGEVIGVATYFSIQGQNLNFAIPSNYLRPMLQSNDGPSLRELAEAFKAQAAAVGASESGGPDQFVAEAPDGSQIPIQRKVPEHELSVLEDCSRDQLTAVAQAILGAIEKGAPIYNAKEHEACFVIYRKVSAAIESDTDMCKGVRAAFGDGLLRASSLDSFTEKAWALRDTFDGMLDVIGRKFKGEQ